VVAECRQIIPSASNGHDAVNFRHMKESHSLQLEREQDGARTEGGGDLFNGFSSVTLVHDEE
jgi:protein-serine/threonine kinase